MNKVEIPSVETYEEAIHFGLAGYERTNRHGNYILRANQPFQMRQESSSIGGRRSRNILYNPGELITAYVSVY